MECAPIEIRTETENSHYVILEAYAGDNDVGVLHFLPKEDHIYLRWLTIYEDCRGKGYSKSLLSEFSKIMDDECKVATLDVAGPSMKSGENIEQFKKRYADEMSMLIDLYSMFGFELDEVSKEECMDIDNYECPMLRKPVCNSALINFNN